MSYAPYRRSYPKMRRRNQRGGASSDWKHSANAVYIQPGNLTRLTLSRIDQAPMFNPLEYNTIIPTIATGIYPEGIYYMNQAAMKHCGQLENCQEPGLVKRRAKTKRETLIDQLKEAMF